MQRENRSGRRLLRCAGVVLTAVLLMAALAVVCGAEAVYNWVVPMEYPEITMATEDYFLTTAADSEDPLNIYDLYTMDGERVLKNIRWASFYENWIIVVREGDHPTSALYTYDGFQVRIPFNNYTRIWLESEDAAVGLLGDEFRRPGVWEGEAERRDLKTGRITERLGTMTVQASALPERFLSGEALFATCDSPYGIEYRTETDGKVARMTAQNDDGQALLTVESAEGTMNLSHSCHGRILHYYGSAGEKAVNRTYSGRGRLLVEKDTAALMDGQYLLVLDEDAPYLMDKDGEVMIPAGDFTTMLANNADNNAGTQVATSDDLMIVERDGKWGIIRLDPRWSWSSDWAMEETMAAVEAGLVPEDVQYWWRDNCTRQEFCQMLSRAIWDAPDPSSEVSFTDCQDPDVLAMASLGIVKGVGDNRFAPGKFLTRQEAAVMLARAAELLDIKGTEAAATYTDESDFADWGRFGIRRLSTIAADNGTPVMRGVGGGKFSPNTGLTVEQAAIAVYRLTLARRES